MEDKKRIFRLRLLKGVVEDEHAREISKIREKCGLYLRSDWNWRGRRNGRYCNTNCDIFLAGMEISNHVPPMKNCATT